MRTRDTGGALLRRLLEGITGSFREGDRNDVALLRLIMSPEDHLEMSGYLTSDLRALVARKGVARVTPEEATRNGEVKAGIIKRQEVGILAPDRRLEEAEHRNRALLESSQRQLDEIEGLRREREVLVEENAALKSEGPLRTLRFIRAKLWGRRRG